MLDWYDIVSEFYERGIVRKNDLLIEKLRSATPLDSGYLAFSDFFGSIKATGLHPFTPWRSNPRGRPYYGIQYRKNAWFPIELSSGDWRKFEPSKHFDIHIEIQFLRLTGSLDLLIHYETNPYQAQLKAFMPTMKFDGHMKRRQRFKQELSTILKTDFVIAPDRSINQIARKKVDLDGLTVENARKILKRLLATSSQAIDDALDNIQ